MSKRYMTTVSNKAPINSGPSRTISNHSSDVTQGCVLLFCFVFTLLNENIIDSTGLGFANAPETQTKRLFFVSKKSFGKNEKIVAP